MELRKLKHRSPYNITETKGELEQDQRRWERERHFFFFFAM